MPRSLSLLIVLACAGSVVRADPWPNWRGPDNQGHSAETNLPLNWGPKQNVRWRTPLPDAGNSTPAVWGDRVFVTQARGPAPGGRGNCSARR